MLNDHLTLGEGWGFHFPRRPIEVTGRIPLGWDILPSDVTAPILRTDGGNGDAMAVPVLWPPEPVNTGPLHRPASPLVGHSVAVASARQGSSSVRRWTLMKHSVLRFGVTSAIAPVAAIYLMPG